MQNRLLELKNVGIIMVFSMIGLQRRFLYIDYSRTPKTFKEAGAAAAFDMNLIGKDMDICGAWIREKMVLRDARSG